jgi:acetylglutamate kinase
MYARQVFMNLKDAKDVAEITQRLEKKVIPLLRDLKGFLDEITFVTPGRSEALAISLWENKQDADAYNRDTYPKVLKALEGLLSGNPRVETCEVGNSTFHKLAATTA